MAKNATSSVFFSVVIPLYNKADTIERALQSVARQTFRDYEVVVVDDGSTDSGPEIVKSFRGIERIRLIGKSNGGVSSARNRGVREALGQYVVMLDGDDYWAEFHLADLKHVIEAFPGAQVVSTRAASVYNGVASWRGLRRGIGRYDMFDEFMREEPIHSSSVSFDRRFFLRHGGYDERFGYYEDIELYFRLAEDVGLFFANFRVSSFYSHDASCSATSSRRFGYKDFAHWKFLESRLSKGDGSVQLRRCARRVFSGVLYGLVLRFRMEEGARLCRVYPCLSRLVPGSKLLDKRFLRYMIWPMCFVVAIKRKLMYSALRQMECVDVLLNADKVEAR